MFQLLLQLPLNALLLFDLLAAGFLLLLEPGDLLGEMPQGFLRLVDGAAEAQKFAHAQLKGGHGLLGHGGIAQMSGKDLL